MATGFKTGGRSAGTPNKTTSELRNIIQSFLDKNVEELQKNFDLLEPKDKLSFIEKMLQYSLPKMNSVKMDLENTPREIQFINVSKQYPDE